MSWLIIYFSVEINLFIQLKDITEIMMLLVTHTLINKAIFKSMATYKYKVFYRRG